ncbi:flagellar protein G [Halorubellus sp. JP-L1]|uniref:flagellar protein G n=1 Tax=Halorubellus sp. JP-L1 TaxID=2715753 RepID=UPI0014073BED|nr:flagellar protein G [Halorubellus sp. JP-L1]NHN41649.1 flagellar protein G [Halorubellus sp. JP-L1]
MASSSVSSLILFIAAMIIAASVAGTMVTNVAQVSDAIDSRSVDAEQRIDTEIEIISDPGSSAVYDDGSTTVSLLVKNTGANTLPAEPGKVDVIVDGEYVSASAQTFFVLDETSWRTGTVVRLEIDRSLDPGEHRVVLVVNGDREEFTFYV